MSSENTPKASNASTSPAQSTAPGDPPRKGKWRRRIILTLATLFVLLLAFRVALHIALPTVLRMLAAPFGLDVSIDRQEITILGSNASMWGFKVTPKSGGEPLLVADYVHANISTLKLFTGTLEVWRAEADQVQIDIERTADGRIPKLEKVLELLAKQGEPAPPASGPITFMPPLVLEALRASHVTISIRDKAVTPEFSTRVMLDARVNDLAPGGKPASLEADAWVEDLLDSARVRAQLSTRDRKVDGAVRVWVAGLHPAKAAGYLRPFGLEPVADNLSGELSLRLTADAADGAPVDKPGPLKASVVLDRAICWADNTEIASLKKLELTADSLDFDAAKLRSLMIEGVRANGSRMPNGQIRVAGMVLRPPTSTPRPAATAAPAPAQTSAASTPSAAPAPAGTPAAAPGGKPYLISLAEFAVRDVRAVFADHAVTPASDLTFVVNEIASKDLVLNSSDASAKWMISGSCAAPGVAEAIRFTLDVSPFAPERRLAATFDVTGITPEALRGQLAALGLESDWHSATASGSARLTLAPQPDGGSIINASFDKLTLVNGTPDPAREGAEPASQPAPAELAAMSSVKVGPVYVSGDGRRIRIETIELSGPAVAAGRDSQGILALLGIRVLPGKAATTTANTPTRGPSSMLSLDETAPLAAEDEQAALNAATTAPAAAGTSATASAPSTTAPTLPRIEIGSIVWKNVRMDFHDEFASPPMRLAVDDAGLEIHDLVFDLAGSADPSGGGAATVPAGRQSRIHGWLSAPGLARAILLDGTITPGPGSVQADLKVSGQNLTPAILAPYLAPFRVEPVMKDGALEVRASLGLRRLHNGDLSAGVLVHGATLKEGDTELLGLDKFEVKDATINEKEITLGEVHIARPRATVLRDSTDALSGAGVRLLLRPAAPSTSPTTAPRTAQRTAVAATSPMARAALLGQLDTIVRLGKLTLADAELHWIDSSGGTAVDTTFGVGARLDALTLGRPAAPAKFDVSLRIKDVLESLAVNGTIDATPGALALQATADGRGLRAGPLGAYLPPNVRISLTDGRLAAKLAAAARNNPAGGVGVAVDVNDVSYRDGESATPAFAMQQLRLDAPRIDLDAGLITIDRFTISGVEADLELAAGGRMRALGVELAGAESADRTRPETTTGPAAPSNVEAVVADNSSAAEIIGAAQKPLPLITVQTLDLELKRATLRNSAVEGAAPLTVADLRLKNSAPVELGGPDATDRPPVKLVVSGRVDPIVGGVNVNLAAAPFAPQPNAKLDLSVQKIRGEGLTELVPTLKDKVDGSKLTDGSFRLDLETQAKVRRRGAKLDFARGFDLDFLLKDIAYRATPDGPVLVGLKSMQSEGIRVEPIAGNVHFKTLEIDTPIALLTRESDGIHALGWVIKLPQTSAGAPSDAAGAEAPVAAAAAQPKPEPAPAPTGTGEIVIDRLLVSGIDVRVEDRTTTPPVIVPLTGLDVELRGLSDKVMTQPRPIRIAAVVNAGKVPIPAREKQDATDERDLFSQATANGTVTLYPEPQGYLKASLSGLELAALKGAAQQFGIVLQGGVFDADITAKLQDARNLDLNTKFVFTDLDLSEPADGPLSRGLKLPVPLDAAIAAVEDPSGGITLAIPVPIRDGEISMSAVTSSAVGAVAGVVATGIASTGVKAVAGVGDLLGGGGPDGARDEPQLVILTFPAGYTGIGPADRDRMRLLLEALRDSEATQLTLRHDLSAADVERARLRANPSADEAAALAGQLRQQRGELLARRAELASRARGELAAGASSAPETIAALRSTDRQLADLEDGMDRLYELLRPGADRQADRRTRAAALQIATERLEMVKATLAAALLASPDEISDANERVRILNAKFTVAEPGPGDPAAGEGGTVTATIVTKGKK